PCGLFLLPPPRAARHRDASARARADGGDRAGRPRSAPPLRPSPRAGPAALRLRLALARGRPRAVALRARRPPPAAGLVRRRYPPGRSARRPGVHDGYLMGQFFSRMIPTLRGFLIIVAIAAVVVVLQLEATVVALLILARVAFILAIAFFIFLMWRER